MAKEKKQKGGCEGFSEEISWDTLPLTVARACFIIGKLYNCYVPQDQPLVYILLRLLGGL